MAAAIGWRSYLNAHEFCQQLKKNDAKNSSKRVVFDAKALIVTTHDGSLFVWDSYCCHLVYFRLKNLLPECKEKSHRFQILMCTDAPKFEVEGISLNQSASHICLWGQTGVKVIELPRRYGKYGEFEGGKETISCRTIPIGENYFTGQQGIKLRHLAWHPGSSSDSHIVLLTSDNMLRMYDIADGEKPVQTISLEGTERFSFNTSPTKMKLSLALGETAVSFDFGPPGELMPRHRLGIPDVQEPLPVWPVFVVKGNGDVMVAYTSFRFTRNLKLPVLGPLMMHPAAADNYGLDACAILSLKANPPIIVIATSEGKLHNCVLMQTDDTDSISVLSASTSSPSTNSLYEPVIEPTLYVYESIELEMTLTTTRVEDDQPIEDDFTCPIRLVKDPCNTSRYHCCHAAGVHSVVLPWVNSIQKFLTEDDGHLQGHQECIVEHLVCTKPLASSAPAPILGLDIVTDPTLTPTLLALTNDIDFVALSLSTSSTSSREHKSLLSDSPGIAVTSPLRHLSHEPFDQHIAKILLRSSSHPVLKSSAKSELTQQECFQLLTRATQVFREEYIQKQDLARQEIETRVRILQEQKNQQLQDIRTLHQSRNILREAAEGLSTKLVTAQERQETLLKRVDQIKRKIQARIPMLSDAEKHMLKELRTLKGNLEIYAKNLKQINIKQDFQARQMARENRTSGSPAIQKTQVTQLKNILTQEGDEISELMKKVTQLKMESTVW